CTRTGVEVITDDFDYW
nr:immunoglobulin heavy chain junction region [Macaca mulatta]